VDFSAISVTWNVTKNVAVVEVSAPTDVIEFLNTSKRSKEWVAQYLAEVFRYDGPFVFEVDEVPF
jgi:hypothetical protein